MTAAERAHIAAAYERGMAAVAPGGVSDLRVEFEQQSELVRRAEALGIDVSAHICGCEPCLRTSALCPASLTSLEQAVQRAEQDRRPYHERRREMACCPECLDPECFSINCDELEERP